MNGYDVIIIGAGVGGLTCGCYLAQGGKRVLLVEQHRSPGGYCSSFSRKKRVFDSCVHYLGSCREGGQIDTVLRELKAIDEISLIRFEPSDTVLIGKKRVSFSSDNNLTKEHLKEHFPASSGQIDLFFKIVLSKEPIKAYASFSKFRTFQDALEYFFRDKVLINTLGVLTCNMGLVSSEISSLAALTLFREFVLDGGYYPVGGMQKVPDVLLARFKSLGGEVSLNTKVNKVVVDSQRRVEGVITGQTDFRPSKCVIAACDGPNLYQKMFDKNIFSGKFHSLFSKMTVSMSSFIVYIGLNKKMLHNNEAGAVWHVGERQLTPSHIDITKDSTDDGFLLCSLPPQHDKVDALHLIVGASFSDPRYWSSQKEHFINVLIRRAQKMFPAFNIAGMIDYVDAATPATLNRYTGNTGGAMLGWASTPQNLSRLSSLINEIKIRGFLQVGHWAKFSGSQGGIPMVMSSGRHVAKQILRSPIV